MLQIEKHVGTLSRVNIKTFESIEDWCKHYCNNNGVDTMPKYCGSWKASFLQKFGDKYFIFDNSVYSISEDKEELFEFENEFKSAYSKDKDEIKFSLLYNNEVLSVSEAMNLALRNLD